VGWAWIVLLWVPTYSVWQQTLLGLL